MVGVAVLVHGFSELDLGTTGDRLKFESLSPLGIGGDGESILISCCQGLGLNSWFYLFKRDPFGASC